MAGGLLCLLVGLAVSAVAPTNFAGEWLLDKSKSEMPQMGPGGPGGGGGDVTLIVTQDDKQLTSETKRSGGDGGGPGGGRGMGGGGKLTYSLDGKKATTEVTGPNGNTSTVDTEAKWDKAQKGLELKSVRHVNFQGNAMDFTTKETWELAEDGKTLTIKRSSESPRGTQESKLVFVKK